MTDNLSIWNAVSKTNPAHTKKVNQRGGFTAISAQYQILAATEQFGPIGIGWGYDAQAPILLGDVVTVGVTIWHGSRENRFGPVWGGADLKDSKGKFDSDAPKKAETDGITKGLSQLGFNADVFLGKFDDNKYVAGLEREFADAGKSDSPTGPINDKTRDWLAGLIDKAQIPVGDVCRQFEVTSLKALTYERINDVRAWIEANKKAA